MTDDEYLAAIDELATVYNHEQAAHHLLDRIGFPIPERPVFAPNSRAFWRKVCKEVQAGLTPGGLEALLDEARRPGPAPGFRTMATPPDGFVHRRELDEIRALLCAAAEDGGAVGITTALRGAGGFGKTTLAQALAFDDDVRAAYPDGVLWATMGDKLGDADRLARVQGLLEWWDPAEKGVAFTTLESASARLREVLTSHRVLLVVDDVWQSAAVEAFRGAASLLRLVNRARRRARR